MPRKGATRLVDDGKSLSSLPPSADQPANMSLPELEKRCREEMAIYWRNGASNDCYALEILKRAMIQNNPQAWDSLQQCFAGVVRLWMHRHTRWELAYALDSEENYIAQTFARFWRASVNNPRLRFDTLAAALDYLRASLNGAIMDTLRAYSRPHEIPLPDPGYPLYADEEALDTTDDSGELWDAINNLLSDARERRLAYLHFHCGLKAREIVHFCPREFNDVQEVYRMRHNIFKRLMRNVDQLRWRLSCENI